MQNETSRIIESKNLLHHEVQPRLRPLPEGIYHRSILLWLNPVLC